MCVCVVFHVCVCGVWCAPPIEDHTPTPRFRELPGLLTMPDGQKAVKQYNRLARTLTEFELLWCEAWAKGAQAAQGRLRAPLLIKHPETGIGWVCTGWV